MRKIILKIWQWQKGNFLLRIYFCILYILFLLGFLLLWWRCLALSGIVSLMIILIQRCGFEFLWLFWFLWFLFCFERRKLAKLFHLFCLFCGFFSWFGDFMIFKQGIMILLFVVNFWILWTCFICRCLYFCQHFFSIVSQLGKKNFLQNNLKFYEIRIFW